MLKELMLKSVIIAFACSISFVAHAIADSPKLINVPAGDLVQGLETLAKQADVELVFQAVQLKGLRTRGVSGNLTAHEAVTKLLEGTNLQLRIDQSTGAMLIAPQGQGGAGPSNPSSGNPSDTTSNGGKEGKKDSSDRFLVAQVDQGQTSSPSTVGKQDEQTLKKKPQLEEVIVTGSRIPEVAKEGSQPLRSYTRSDIEQSGQTTVADFLNTLPDVSTSSTEDTYNSVAGLPGKTTVNLHGLPSGTTLVLLNGLRVESGYQNIFDLNNIPLSAIERIDVLPVGASAIYGADALAGAVNIILRKDLSGFEVNGKYGYASGTDEADANLGWGKTWERGSISLIGSYQGYSELLGTERALTSTANLPSNTPSFYLTDACSPGNVYSPNGQNLPGLSSPEAGIPAGISGIPTIQQFVPTEGKLNLCNIRSYISLIPQTRREGVLLSGEYKVTDSMAFFTDVLLSHEKIDAHEAQTPGGVLMGASDASLAANNPYNPFGEAVNVSFAFPAEGLQDRDESGNYIRTLIGIKGSLFSHWNYEAVAYLSHDVFQADDTFSSGSAIQSALNSSDPATALNPFAAGTPGSPQLLQTLSQADSDYRQRFTTQIVDGQATLRGPLLQLPAGQLQTVIGGEYSRESQLTGITGNPTLDLYRDSYAVFTEEKIPLLADTEHAQQGDRLSLTLAGRYDHANDFGGKATWQSTLLWRPTKALLFRGGYGTSYEAPSLPEISGGILFSYMSPVSDPLHGGETVTPNIAFGANPNLKAETGDSGTLGVVYSSQALRGFDASLNWFSVDITNYISVPSPQVIVDNENLYPGGVIRSSSTGQIIQVNELYYNFGALHVAGFDADVRYAYQVNAGQFTPSLSITEIYKWQSALTPGSPLISYVSEASTNPGFAPRWKGTAALAWKRGPLLVNIAGRYIGKYQDYQDVEPNSNELGNFWICDLNARYTVGDALASNKRWFTGTYVELGAVNLFDEAPRFSYGGLPYDPEEYDIRGRFIYMQLGLKW